MTSTAFLLQSCGDGVDDNAQFELAVAGTLGLGLAVDTAGELFGASGVSTDRARLAILIVLIARLLLSTRLEPYLVLTSPQYRNLFPASVEILQQEVTRIHATPGPVHCLTSSVCRRAGKPFAFDRFAMDERVKTGHMTQDKLDARLHAAGIRIEPIDPRVSVNSLLRRYRGPTERRLLRTDDGGGPTVASSSRLPSVRRRRHTVFRASTVL
jgi:hypothetical protein